jgi:hypothetical protein
MLASLFLVHITPKTALEAAALVSFANPLSLCMYARVMVALTTSHSTLHALPFLFHPMSLSLVALNSFVQPCLLFTCCYVVAPAGVVHLISQ